MRSGSQSVRECSTSTSVNSQQGAEDDWMITVILSEEYAKLDGAVGRCQANLAPLLHICQVNTYIPTFSDTSLDHQRLLQSSVLFQIRCISHLSITSISGKKL